MSATSSASSLVIAHDKMFLRGCHAAWIKTLAEATEKGNNATKLLAESKIKGVCNAYKHLTGEDLPAPEMSVPTDAPNPTPTSPTVAASSDEPTVPDPPTIDALLARHIWLSRWLKDENEQEISDIRDGTDRRTICDNAEFSQAYDELEDIAKQYKELTRMDMPGTVRELHTIPVKPGAPSPALFLDLYPTGSDGQGLPICVMSKLIEHVSGRDPTDSGVDLPTPATQVIPPHTTVRIKLGIRATSRSAITYLNRVTGKWEGLMLSAHREPFWLVPRSSLSKTPLILANSIGVIDAGYNGELMAAFHNTSDKPYEVKQFDRLVQTVSGNLTPFYQIKVRGPQERPDKTMRGDGAYGSTGK
jgi:dUTP pyrophosphatase